MMLFLRVAGVFLSMALAFGAQAQQPPGQPRTKREYLQQHPAVSKPAYPMMSKDFLTGLETLGVRPGMTLPEARAAAAKWGAALEKEDQSNLSDNAKPSPANVYNPLHIAPAFTYRSVPDATYSGHPHVFDPDRPDQAWQAGATTVSVYPIDPLGDYEDPNNLIVYYVNTMVTFQGQRARTEGVMSKEAFFAEGEKRIGLKLSTAMTGDRAQCAFALKDYVQRMYYLAAAYEPKPQPYLEAWKACGPIAMVEPNYVGGGVFGYQIRHSDITIAERAYNAFRVYGSEQPRDR
ncbi:MAG: hypothetical protein R3C58_01640 [Parvularculaceae bacterium]